MIFPDKESRAGFFEQNFFKRALHTLKEIDPYRKSLTSGCIERLEEYVNRNKRFRSTLTALEEQEEESHKGNPYFAERDEVDYKTQNV